MEVTQGRTSTSTTKEFTLLLLVQVRRLLNLSIWQRQSPLKINIYHPERDFSVECAHFLPLATEECWLLPGRCSAFSYLK